MSKESYVSGFAKVAQAMGVDPAQLVKIAEGNDLMFDPEKGRYRRMTPIEWNIAREIPVPQEETGVSLKETAKARAARLDAIREKAKKMELGDVNPTMSDLSRFFEYAKKNYKNPSYMTGLSDSVPDDWKRYLPAHGALPYAMWDRGDDGTHPHAMKYILHGISKGKVPKNNPIDTAMLKALYSGHTNLLERVNKKEYPPVEP